MTIEGEWVSASTSESPIERLFERRRGRGEGCRCVKVIVKDVLFSDR